MIHSLPALCEVLWVRIAHANNLLAIWAFKVTLPKEPIFEKSYESYLPIAPLEEIQRLGSQILVYHSFDTYILVKAHKKVHHNQDLEESQSNFEFPLCLCEFLRRKSKSCRI